jgi:hypothetical protein
MQQEKKKKSRASSCNKILEFFFQKDIDCLKIGGN